MYPMQPVPMLTCEWNKSFKKAKYTSNVKYTLLQMKQSPLKGVKSETINQYNMEEWLRDRAVRTGQDILYMS